MRGCALAVAWSDPSAPNRVKEDWQPCMMARPASRHRLSATEARGQANATSGLPASRMLIRPSARKISRSGPSSGSSPSRRSSALRNILRLRKGSRADEESGRGEPTCVLPPRPSEYAPPLRWAIGMTSERQRWTIQARNRTAAEIAPPRRTG
jgi:hypothetical protein